MSQLRPQGTSANDCHCEGDLRLFRGKGGSWYQVFEIDHRLTKGFVSLLDIAGKLSALLNQPVHYKDVHAPQLTATQRIGSLRIATNKKAIRPGGLFCLGS